MNESRGRILVAVLMLTGACTGNIDGAIGGAPTAPSSPGAPGPSEPASAPPVPGAIAPPSHPSVGDPGLTAYGAAGVRRLSREELAQSIGDLLGVDVRDKLEQMPVDPVSTPFDNNHLDQVPSAALLEGVKAVADAAVDRVLADAATRDRLVPCKPSGADDAACLRLFIERVGRRILRRPLAADEVERYAAVRAIAIEAKDFHAGVEVLLRALLQSPEFIYRIETGEAVSGTPGVVRLSGFEIAARLAHLLWGSTPNDALLDQAARGALGTAEQVRAAASAMLVDPRGAARIKRFHAMWLSYADIQADPALAKAMRREADALVERFALQPGGSWLGLFRAPETFVDATLAAHYGLAAPTGGSGWVPYPAASGRKGILAHAAVLTNGQKFGKTSVVQRGLYVRSRLLCEHVPDPPPEAGVDVDQEPKGAGPCKADNIRAHATKPQCAGCHRLLDPVGAGLEAFDLLGRARTKDESGCEVRATGEIAGAGGTVTFSGPGELGDVLAGSGQLDACFTQQLYSFAVGRPAAAADTTAVQWLARRFRDGRHQLPALILDFVSAPAFFHRVVEGT